MRTSCTAVGLSGRRRGIIPKLLALLAGTVLTSTACYAASALLEWIPPQRNDDGSLLNNLTSYRAYWNCGAGSGYPFGVTFPAPASSYTLDGLPDVGTCRFVLTALNSDGRESAFSNEAQKLMGVLEPPGAPSVSIEFFEHQEPSVTIARVGGTGLELATGNNSSGNLTWPGGLSADHVAVLLVSWFEGGSGGGANTTFNTPTDFTLQGTSVAIGGSGSSESRVAIYTKELTGSESGNLAVSFSGNSFANVIMDVYSGDGDLTIASVTAGTPASGTTATAPSVAGTSGQGLIAGYGTSDPTTMTTPTGMSAGQVGGQNTNTGRLFYETLSATGATGTRQSTLGTSRDNVGFSILIDDAGGGGGGAVQVNFMMLGIGP